MFRRAFALLAGSLALAGCVTPQPAPVTLRGGPSPLAYAADSASAPVASSVGILAPLSGPNAERGQALVQAAQLALSAPGSPTLIVKDTAGTPQGAIDGATQAIAAGATVLIGPLTGAETAAAAPIAQRARVPMLAFTNDAAQARPGVWPLGISPGQQVRRLAGAVAAEGRSRLAALLPQGAFGTAMAEALVREAAAARLPPPTIRRYGPSAAAMATAAHDLSGRDRRGSDDAAPRPPVAFEALLLADTGAGLAQIAALLPAYDMGGPGVRVLGPVLWAAPATRTGADLQGAWYAAPDPASSAAFNQAFQAKYGAPAPGLSDVAFDAASIARVIAQRGAPPLTRPDGFGGVDGLLALNPDGSVRRGLALFEIQSGGAAAMVQPAPDGVGAPGV